MSAKARDRRAGRKKKDMRQAMIYLRNMAFLRRWQQRFISIMAMGFTVCWKRTPYQMADHISGVGLRTADEIAKRIGIHTDLDYRIRVEYFIHCFRGVNAGHIFLDEELFGTQGRTIAGSGSGAY